MVCNHLTRRQCWGSMQWNYSRRSYIKIQERNTFALDHQHGRRDVTCKPAIDEPCIVKMSFLPPPRLVYNLFVAGKIIRLLVICWTSIKFVVVVSCCGGAIVKTICIRSRFPAFIRLIGLDCSIIDVGYIPIYGFYIRGIYRTQDRSQGSAFVCVDSRINSSYFAVMRIVPLRKSSAQKRTKTTIFE